MLRPGLRSALPRLLSWSPLGPADNTDLAALIARAEQADNPPFRTSAEETAEYFLDPTYSGVAGRDEDGLMRASRLGQSLCTPLGKQGGLDLSVSLALDRIAFHGRPLKVPGEAALPVLLDQSFALEACDGLYLVGDLPLEGGPLVSAVHGLFPGFLRCFHGCALL